LAQLHDTYDDDDDLKTVHIFFENVVMLKYLKAVFENRGR